MKIDCEIPARELHAVELPLVLHNDALLMDMLGGVDQVARVFQCEKRKLPLSFRPNMLFSRPTYGEPTPAAAVVLRIQRLRHRKTGETKLVASIVSRVNRTYKFLGMTDFQFGPFERIRRNDRSDQSVPPGGDTYRVFYDDLVLREPTTALDPFLSRDAPLFLPPMHFFRQDIPMVYNFASRYRSSEYIEMEEKTQQLPVARKHRQGQLHVIGFEDPTPTEPTESALENLSLYSTDGAALSAKMGELFQQRPIWIRSAIWYHIRVGKSHAAFKFALYSNAYNMLRGPWGRTWIRFGYDPRTDPESRYYQVVDFRIKSDVIIRKILERKASDNSVLTEQDTKNTALLPLHRTDIVVPPADVPSTDKQSNAPVTSTQSKEQNQADCGEPGVTDLDRISFSDFRFSAEHLPRGYNVLVCLVDIDIPAVQQMVAQKPTRSQCDAIDGWLDPGSINRIRELMAESLQSWLS